MTTRWTIGPDGTIKRNGHIMAPHWVVGVLNQYENDLVIWDALQRAAWELVDESANDIHTSDVVVHSRELWNQLEAALLAAGGLPE